MTKRTFLKAMAAIVGCLTLNKKATADIKSIDDKILHTNIDIWFEGTKIGSVKELNITCRHLKGSTNIKGEGDGFLFYNKQLLHYIWHRLNVRVKSQMQPVNLIITDKLSSGKYRETTIENLWFTQLSNVYVFDNYVIISNNGPSSPLVQGPIIWEAEKMYSIIK